MFAKAFAQLTEEIAIFTNACSASPLNVTTPFTALPVNSSLPAASSSLNTANDSIGWSHFNTKNTLCVGLQPCEKRYPSMVKSSTFFK